MVRSRLSWSRAIRSLRLVTARSAESVVEGRTGVVPNLGDSRSIRAVPADLSATDGDGAELRSGGFCDADGGVTVLGGSGVLFDSVEGRAGVEGASRRWVAMRSISDLRETLLRSEMLGDDACGVRAVALSEPIRPPIPLVPLKPGESLCRGADGVFDNSDLCEPIGVAMRPESRTPALGAGATLGADLLKDGRDGLTAIDLPGLGDGLEGTAGADRLGLMDGLDGVLGADLLMLGVEDRSLMA